MKFESTINGESKTIELESELREVLIDGQKAGYEFENMDDGRHILRTGLRTFVIDNITVNESEVEFTLNGKWIKADIKDEQMLLLDSLGFKVGAKSGEGKLSAPMPGKILNLLVKEGDQVNLGTPVVILEAMKMENELKAPAAGKVAKINVENGQSVEKNHVLLEIEPLG